MNDLQLLEIAVGGVLVLLGALGAFKKHWTRTLALGAGALLIMIAMLSKWLAE